MRLLARVAALVLCLAMLLACHPDVAIATNAKPGGQLEVIVVEHLRIKVPADGRAAWLQAEQGSW